MDSLVPPRAVRGFFMYLAENLLIVGASTRATAGSALRAGLTPRCLDYFGDRDLASISIVHRVEAQEGVAGLERLALGLPAQPWLYTGPLENHAECVDRIAQIHRLCGNAGDTLRAARDPCRMAAVLAAEGLPFIEVRLDARGLPRDGTWLVKPIASVGGRQIQRLGHGTVPLAEPSYFQRFLEGTSHSAMFIAQGGTSQLIGVTRQLHGTPRSPFAYRGNIGPCVVSTAVLARLRRIGDVLSSAFGLVGLFGVDYIEHDGEPWPVELNPRYTAAVEILELALHRPLLVEHLRACGMDPGETRTPANAETSDTNAVVIGKAILYASRALLAPEFAFDDPSNPDLFSVAALADVPWPGSAIAVDEPIMTVFASGQDAEECEQRLAELEVSWRSRLNA